MTASTPSIGSTSKRIKSTSSIEIPVTATEVTITTAMITFDALPILFSLSLLVLHPHSHPPTQPASSQRKFIQERGDLSPPKQTKKKESGKTRDATPTSCGTNEGGGGASGRGQDGLWRRVDGAESTGWLAERSRPPRRSAPRWTRPKRKRTLSCEGKRRSYVCWRGRERRGRATRAQRRSC